MHGSGNDFIVFNDVSEELPLNNNGWLRRIAARRRGIGCDGIIALQKSENADFKMRFFNPDGQEVEMCGNGARCIAKFAFDKGIAPQKMRFETAAGLLKAQIQNENVKLFMTPPRDMAVNKHLKLKDTTITYGFANTGVPHVVVAVKDLADYDVVDTGAAIRYHDNFAPAGTNANFITVTGTNKLSIRTYERGVEGETLACGTGITAAAIIATVEKLVTAPVRVITAGGDELTVDFKHENDSVTDVTLLGPAMYSFSGEVKYNP